MPLVGDRPPGGHADDQLSLRGADPGGTPLAQRVRRPRRDADRPRRLRAPRRLRSAALGGRPGLLSDLPGALRERRPLERPGGRRLDLSWPCRASPVVGRAARIRPWRDGRVLRRRSPGHRGAPRSPADLGVDAVYLNPIFRTSLEPRLRHHRLRPRRGAPRWRRGAGLAAARHPRTRHPADPGHRARTTSAWSTRGSGRPRPTRRPRPRPSTSSSAHTPTTTSRGWACAPCPSSTTGAGPARGDVRRTRRPSSRAGCGRRSRSTAGGSTSRTCSAASAPTSSATTWRAGSGRRSRPNSPEAYLIGEHWFDAIDQLAGDQWDGVMDYAGFTLPVLDWLGGHQLQEPRRGHGVQGRAGRRRRRSSRR